MRRSIWIWPLAAALAVTSFASFSTPDAEAKVEVESGYSKSQTYNGALRYLRVDLGYEIVEKDADAGYILFRFEPPGRKNTTTNGSLEVVETKERVKIVIQLPQLPSYHETMLRDGLLKKLRSEYGEPAKKKPRDDSDRAPSDAGAD